MKTFITSIFTALLILQFNQATIAGTTALSPINQHQLSADSDSIGSVSTPSALPVPEEESPVDDIPFDTKKISAGYFVALLPQVEPEQPVNDIPFETGGVAARFLPLEHLGVYAEPEGYIEDIPFNTNRIAERYLNREFVKYCCRTL